MNRALSYLMLGLGAVLGYLGSYFGQSRELWALFSLGDYLANTRGILILTPRAASEFGASARSACLTAWMGLILGVALLGGLAAYLSRTRKRPLP